MVLDIAHGEAAFVDCCFVHVSTLQPWNWQLTGIGYSTMAQASGAHWTRSYAARRTTPQSTTLGFHPVIHVPNYMDHYSFADSWGRDGWVGHVGWPTADGLTRKWSPICGTSVVGTSETAKYSRCDWLSPGSLCKWLSQWLVPDPVAVWPSAFVESQGCHGEAAFVDCCLMLLIGHLKVSSLWIKQKPDERILSVVWQCWLVSGKGIQLVRPSPAMCILCHIIRLFACVFL